MALEIIQSAQIEQDSERQTSEGQHVEASGSDVQVAQSDRTVVGRTVQFMGERSPIMVDTCQAKQLIDAHVDTIFVDSEAIDDSPCCVAHIYSRAQVKETIQITSSFEDGDCDITVETEKGVLYQKSRRYLQGGIVEQVITQRVKRGGIIVSIRHLHWNARGNLVEAYMESKEGTSVSESSQLMGLSAFAKRTECPLSLSPGGSPQEAADAFGIQFADGRPVNVVSEMIVSNLETRNSEDVEAKDVDNGVHDEVREVRHLPAKKIIADFQYNSTPYNTLRLGNPSILNNHSIINGRYELYKVVPRDKSFVYERHFSGPLDFSRRHHLGRLDFVRYIFVSIKNYIMSFFSEVLGRIKQHALSSHQPVQETQTQEGDESDFVALDLYQTGSDFCSAVPEQQIVLDFGNYPTEEEEFFLQKYYQPTSILTFSGDEDVDVQSESDSEAEQGGQSGVDMHAFGGLDEEDRGFED